MNKTKYYDKNIVELAEMYKNFSAMYDANKWFSLGIKLPTKVPTNF
jgi:hypothetical protein